MNREWTHTYDESRLDRDDRVLLDLIQLDLPLVTHPFARLGEQCTLPEQEVIRRIKRFFEQGLVRNVGALIDGKKIGYKSTLVAVSVKQERIEEVAERINLHPGVSHNYLRNYPYNIWFTLALPRERDFRKEIKQLLDPEGELQDDISFIILPSIETFKIRVKFQFDTTGNDNDANSRSQDRGVKQPEDHGSLPEIGEQEKNLLAAIQNSIPIAPRPWSLIGDTIGMREHEVMDLIESLKNRSVIRRISAVLRHRRMGYTANGMACFDVPDDWIGEAGRIAASFSEVSHCYRRPRMEAWSYPLFAMIHSGTREECRRIAAEIADSVACRDYVVLFSEREFKKERVQYFTAPS